MQIKARFDDINPNTDFDILREAVNKFSKDIAIILGVIPNCLDKFLSNKSEYSEESINIINELARLPNVYIFQHGTDHLINRINEGTLESEFMFYDFYQQKDIINKGLLKLNSLKINAVGFMPPFHGYDINTIKAARELGFKYFCSVDDYEIPGIKFLKTNINYSRNSIIADLFSTNNIFCYHLEVEHHQKVFKDIDTINKAHKLKILERYLGETF